MRFSIKWSLNDLRRVKIVASKPFLELTIWLDTISIRHQNFFFRYIDMKENKVDTISWYIPPA